MELSIVLPSKKFTYSCLTIPLLTKEQAISLYEKFPLNLRILAMVSLSASQNGLTFCSQSPF